MARYVPYVRSQEGYIERSAYAILNAPDGSSDSCLAVYVHEEQFDGWSESKVYWAAKVGPSVGIAPLDFPSDPRADNKCVASLQAGATSGSQKSAALELGRPRRPPQLTPLFQ